MSDGRGLSPCGRPDRFAAQFASNLVERASDLLKPLDLEQALEMRGPIVLPASDTQRCRQQCFLNVIPDGAARYAA